MRNRELRRERGYLANVDVGQRGPALRDGGSYLNIGLTGVGPDPRMGKD